MKERNKGRNKEQERKQRGKGKKEEKKKEGKRNDGGKEGSKERRKEETRETVLRLLQQNNLSKKINTTTEKYRKIGKQTRKGQTYKRFRTYK